VAGSKVIPQVLCFAIMMTRGHSVVRTPEPIDFDFTTYPISLCPVEASLTKRLVFFYRRVAGNLQCDTEWQWSLADIHDRAGLFHVVI